jgi:NhaP-type Na+/H+ or K+/H+ antiporter
MKYPHFQWYGGLRGAVCFALCETLDEDFRYKKMFLTTTYVIIGVTVFAQVI